MVSRSGRWRIGFIGTGAMAEAILRGVLASEIVRPDEVVGYDIRRDRLQEVANRFGIAAADDLSGAFAADLAIVAVKPQHMAEALSPMAGRIGDGTCVVSIAAGVSTAAIERTLGEGVPVVRVMPNTPCLVGEGAIAVSRGRFATAAHEDEVVRLFGAVGEVVVVPETQIDIVTGLSGSGPAYLCLVVEALADGAVAAGLPRDLALRLAAQTVAGTGRLVLEGLRAGEHPAQLRDRVTSPGGTTARGLEVLEERAVRAAFQQAVQAAARRARELGEES